MTTPVEAVPSIFGRSSGSARRPTAASDTKDPALRKRGFALNEAAVREAAVAARAKALWAHQWRATTTEVLPMTATARPTTATLRPSPLAATTTGVAYTSLEQAEFWAN